MALAGFAVTATTFLTATPAGASVVLPTTGTPVTALVENTGIEGVWVQLGSSSVVAVPFESLFVGAGQSQALTIGGNTYLAATSQIRNVGVSITVGT